MIVDASAIMAMLLDEPERAGFTLTLQTAEARRISAGTWIELSAVAVRGRAVPLGRLEQFLRDAQLTIEPVTTEQAIIGHDAYRTYGIGSNHRARLNFGDCFAYALAKATGEPLLFKGDEFTHTDIVSALPRP